MATQLATDAGTTPVLDAAPLTHRPGRWIDGWNPEDSGQWASVGRAIARRNLGPVDLRRVPRVRRLGAVEHRRPAAARRRLRPHRRPDVLAHRRCPASSAPRCASPTRSRCRSSAAATGPSCPRCCSCSRRSRSRSPCRTRQLGFPVLLAVAALAGVGGGNFASSMANISFFYPEKEKGRALGLNAAGGNLGTAAVQFAVPLVDRRRAPGWSSSGPASCSCRSSSSRRCWPGGTWTTCPTPRRTRAPTASPPGRGTPGSSRSSTSAPSARSSASPGRSRRC